MSVVLKKACQMLLLFVHLKAFGALGLMTCSFCFGSDECIASQESALLNPTESDGRLGGNF